MELKHRRHDLVSLLICLKRLFDQNSWSAFDLNSTEQCYGALLSAQVAFLLAILSGSRHCCGQAATSWESPM